MNPTSNVRTGVCPSFADHPLRKYFDQGLLVTLNSDDPAFFGSDLANEFLLAHTEQGFTREELRQLAANSIQASFLPETEKTSWLAQINTIRVITTPVFRIAPACQRSIICGIMVCQEAVLDVHGSRNPHTR